jgi:hypothetical protein
MKRSKPVPARLWPGRLFVRREQSEIGSAFCRWKAGDGTDEGKPTDLTRRRWRNFGLSGAKLIWGGEAVAVRFDGRANPQQLVLNENTLADIAGLREILQDAHREQFTTTGDLLIGLQLTHSGRFARPRDKRRLEPRVVYRHPLLDRRFGLADDRAVFTDDEIARLIDDFVQAARLAHRAGFAFVDVKHCHGYLGHEFLSAVDRPGRYGGSLENRTSFLSARLSRGSGPKPPGLKSRFAPAFSISSPSSPGRMASVCRWNRTGRIAMRLAETAREWASILPNRPGFLRF